MVGTYHSQAVGRWSRCRSSYCCWSIRDGATVVGASVVGATVVGASVIGAVIVGTDVEFVGSVVGADVGVAPTVYGITAVLPSCDEQFIEKTMYLEPSVLSTMLLQGAFESQRD